VTIDHADTERCPNKKNERRKKEESRSQWKNRERKKWKELYHQHLLSCWIIIRSMEERNDQQ
jgi:hypothetical protein